ncbi:MAG: prolyl oligopeptidase family serine peptidase [Armatimonadetes bacterium]|nr:prolyl oligopeptidase family serine peptidase [Armatimonadota bacterium]
MAWLSVTAAALLLAAAAAADPLSEPIRESFNCTLDGSRWPYLLQVPPVEPQAVLIYLHGHYSDENQGMTTGIYNDAFGKLRRECLQRRWAYVTAWYGGNSWMGPVAEAGLADLIGGLRQRWPQQPLFLCGGSMGGSSALIFAVRRAELLDGVAAFCPAADVESFYGLVAASADPTLRNIAAAIKLHYTVEGRDLAAELAARSALRHAERLTMPVYLSHGAADGLIPVAGTRALVERLQALGRTVRYMETPDGGHDTPILEANWPEVLGFLAATAGAK